MRRAALLALLAAPVAATAQVSPMPSYDDPRLQTVVYRSDEPVRLVAYPGANLTLMFLPGERIERVVLSDQNAFRVSVVGANDSLNIQALRPDANASMSVETGARRYAFALETGEGLAAAYVVRFVNETSGEQVSTPPPPELMTGAYRVSGSNRVRPARISDDGRRTYIEWGEYQALPAVFAVGASDEEEVVDGYMRGGVFTIDRIYSELVFRIDDERARARRLSELGASEG
jgi:type IV secretion system protein VirB9